MSDSTQADRIKRAVERNKADKAETESGRPTQWAPAPTKKEEPPLEPVIETPDNTLTLEGAVESKGRKMGLQGQNATLGKVEMNLKRGGSVTGKLEISYLNVPLLDALAKLDENRKNRKYKVTISIEEQ